MMSYTCSAVCLKPRGRRMSRRRERASWRRVKKR